MPKVSIIVPVYKVEKYLDECVESLINQTYSDFEIILVDDGSPDRCGLICDEWAVKDSRIVCVHKENGGISSARNAGLEHAAGEYIVFVDSDDYVDSKYLEILVSAMEESKADVVMCGSKSVWLDHEGHAEHLPQTPTMLEGKAFAHEFLIWLGAYAVVWNKIFKKSLFDNISFHEGRIFEDMYFTTDVIKHTKTWSIIPEQLYFYRMRKSSMINTKRIVLSSSMYAATQYLCQKFDDDAELAFLAKKLQLNQLLNYYVDEPKEEYTKWKMELRNCKRELFGFSGLTVKQRLKFETATLFPKLYCRWIERKKQPTHQFYE